MKLLYIMMLLVSARANHGLRGLSDDEFHIESEPKQNVADNIVKTQHEISLRLGIIHRLEKQIHAQNEFIADLESRIKEEIKEN